MKATGKTIDEAVVNGLEQLGLTKEEVTFDVIQEPENGFLGFGKKEAIIEMVQINTMGNIAEKFLGDIFKAMNIEATITTHLEDINLYVNISGEKMGLIIGRRGQTLDALQYLVSLAINKNADHYYRVILDTENYREKREKTLEQLADKMAGKAIRYEKRMALEPMNPAERRIIHAHLQDNEAVYTFSEGHEPYRRVVIGLKE